MSAKIIAFPLRSTALDDIGKIDLVTAVDVVIRDLRDLLQDTDADLSRRIAESLMLLENAFRDASHRAHVS